VKLPTQGHEVGHHNTGDKDVKEDGYIIIKQTVITIYIKKAQHTLICIKSPLKSTASFQKPRRCPYWCKTLGC